MKLMLKWVLLLLILVALIYATSPQWLPHVLGRQLPDAWQLEQLDTDYPGISGIRVKNLKITGFLQAADIELAASDIHFNYRDFNASILSLKIDVLLHSVEDTTTKPEHISLDDLSFPVFDLSGKIPGLSIDRVHVSLHHDAASATAAEALTLDLGALNLAPGTDNDYHLVTQLSFKNIPIAPGRLELDISDRAQTASINFPADEDSEKWLSLLVEQVNMDDEQQTRFQAIIDAGAAEQQWIDSILARGSGGVFRHIEGQLKVQAGFAGNGRQRLEHLSVETDNLQLHSDDESLVVQTRLSADREQQNIRVNLPTQTVIQYQDETGRIDRLLARAFPELRRTAQTAVHAVLSLEPGSTFNILPGPPTTMQFGGGLLLEVDSDDENLLLQSDVVSIAITDFPNLESIILEGQARAEWNERTAFQLVLQNLTLTADGLSAQAEFEWADGALVSNGSARLLQPDLSGLATSARSLEISWQDFDPVALSGNFFTQTHGFKTTSDGATWEGFDFTLNYLIENAGRLTGSGDITFEKGTPLPIELLGNLESGQWKVRVPPVSIRAKQLAGMLKHTPANLPAALKLQDGHLDLEGELLVDGMISGTFDIKGQKFDASIKESRADDMDFNFNTVYDREITVEGPVSIEKIALAGGVDVTGIKADLSLKGTDTLSMKDINASVFDGQLHLASLHYANDQIADTIADLTHINLESIIQFADIDGLSGTGFIDLSLPISQEPTGMVVHDGTFSSIGTGRLSYKREGITAVNIGMQALENFHYKRLSGTVNYEADGQYQISIRLEGSNPDLYDGYPVVFNLNVTGTMPALFESMFITGNFEEAIMNQVKSR